MIADYSSSMYAFQAMLLAASNCRFMCIQKCVQSAYYMYILFNVFASSNRFTRLALAFKLPLRKARWNIYRNKLLIFFVINGRPQMPIACSKRISSYQITHH